MFPILIIREEVVCLVILLLLMLNSRYYKMGKDSKSFLRMSTFGLCHVFFDIITVLTVNRLDTVAPWVNWCAHVIFYLFAILFANEFFCYTAALCVSRRVLQRLRLAGRLAPLGYLCLLPVLPIEYLHGAGTNYSFGPAAFVGYGLAMAYLLGSLLLVLLYSKKLEPHVKTALLPMLVAMMVAETGQILMPELLFTGGAITVIMVGFFFSLENPAEVFRQKMKIDALTGVQSRHSYEAEIPKLEALYQRPDPPVFGMVYCDLNDLKTVNNRYGHPEGDIYISGVAQILLRQLKSADAIYRMGGDEFLAIYQGQGRDILAQEVESVHAACDTLSRERAYTVRVAIGWCMSGSGYASLREVLKVADYRMFKNKNEGKREQAYAAGRNGEALNIAGLTDRIFDAFAAMGGRSSPFICNTETNVSRLSPFWVEQFGLPGEFIYDFNSLWAERIHPDDRAAFLESTNAVLSGARETHDMEYRALNRNGDYVVCTCRGSLLKGKNGEPDLFAGALVNYGIAELIDPVTGLRNEQALTDHISELIAASTPAVIMKVSIMSFSRINMLYGAASGNDILCQFAACLQRAIGPEAKVFRSDGTKFVLCLPRATRADAAALYRELQAAATREIRMSFALIPLQVAGGALVLPAGFTGSQAAIRSSLIYAHEQSKYEQQGKLVFYNEPTADQESGDYRLLTSIHQDAIGSREGFCLRYQPIVRMETGEIMGAEALLRWRNNPLGEVSPGLFIPWLENDPCFFELGLWILRRAIADAKALLPIIPDFIINVNITVQQLQHDSFRSSVLSILRETGYPPRQLCLELTERCKELDVAFLKQEIDFFHSLSVRVALDDVGTGTASFALLLNLPLDEVKLDKTLVQSIREKQANQILTQSIIEASESLRYMVCFEGIEDQATYEYLRQHKNACYQGYFFARPMLAEEFRARALAQKSSGRP